MNPDSGCTLTMRSSRLPMTGTVLHRQDSHAEAS